MSKPPPTETFWFDETAKGELIDERTAIVRQQGGNIVHHLGELLLASEFQYKSGDFPQQPKRPWETEELLAAGGLAIRALEDAGDMSTPDKRFTGERFNRLHILGVGPSRAPVTRHFHSMAHFREALGIHEGRTDKYSQWSPRQLEAYAFKVARSLPSPRKLRRSDLEAMYAAGKGPSISFIENHFWSVGTMNEFLGYPDVHHWGVDEYIEYGVHVMLANGSDCLKRELLEVIAGRQRGPRSSTIRTHFGTMAQYRSQVHESLKRRQEKLSSYKRSITNGSLPAEYTELSDDELLQRGARFELINRLAPNISFNFKRTAANRRSADRFATSLATILAGFDLPAMSPGAIELEAREMALEAYIWPLLTRYKDYLYVTDSELTGVRDSNQERLRRWRARQAA